MPIDLGASLVTSINVVGYHRLKEYLGLDGEPIKVANIVLQLAEFEEPLRARFKVDVIGLPLLEPLPGVKNNKWKSWKLPDGTDAQIAADFNPEENDKGDLFIRAPEGHLSHWMPAGTYHFLPHEAPLAEATIEDLESFNPVYLSDEEIEFQAQAARRLHEETDYAIFAWFDGSLMERSQFARGWSQFMKDLIRDPDFVHALIARFKNAAIRDLRKYLEALGEYVDVVGFGDDFGTQTGLQISPEMYRELFLPHHKDIYGFVHDTSQAYVFLHSCGAVYDLISDFITAGVDILNPIQTSADNMAPERIKSVFGDKITFWGGGSDAQGVLPYGTPLDVENDVKTRLEAFLAHGGYVFAPIHDILPDVPPENIVAMYDAAYKYGKYR